LPGSSPATGADGAATATGPVMLKARRGGAKAPRDPQAVQEELGEGQPLEGAVRSRMESAFGMDFSQVRTHTGTTAARLSNEFNARAFTAGRHVAFGAGEYKPGTIIGDALIAHEIAHVVQQEGARSSDKSTRRVDNDCRSLETDADQSAVGALISLWGKTKDNLKDIARHARPRLQSGLTLARCCPTQTVTMSGAQCGAKYGAIGTYCYSGANNWWFKEKVVMGSPNTCVPGATINQTTTPFQASGNCVSDEIFNFNGPPAKVAPCKIVTNQTVFTGPSKAEVENCKYNNEQIVEVTKIGSTSGKVITSSAGESTHCTWP
jgi:hypothetical protein